MSRKRFECTARSYDLGRPARVEAIRIFTAQTERQAIVYAAHYWTRNTKAVPPGCTITAKELVDDDR